MVKEFIIVWQYFKKACNLRCYLQFGTCVIIAILFAPCINMILEVSVADHHHIWHLYCSGCKGIAFWILWKIFSDGRHRRSKLCLKKNSYFVYFFPLNIISRNISPLKLLLEFFFLKITVPIVCITGDCMISRKWAYTWVLLSELNNSFTSTTIERDFAMARIPVGKWILQ